jgi:chemotaxis protein methyltransferase CheR
MRGQATHAIAIDVDDSEGRKEREFNYTDADFERVCAIVYRTVGIRLTEAKRDLVYGRLARRIRQLQLTSFRDYLDLVEAEPEREFTDFVNAITTNLTSFFRERHHFDALRSQVFPELMRARTASRRLRIWSAGCSTGEEPYSLAMTVADEFGQRAGWDVRILATDLDTNVLEHARAGVYNEDRVRQIPDNIRSRWFRRGRGENAGRVRVAPELQDLITFNQLNLMEPWPMRGPFDIIFCRNVVIYFDKPTQTRLFERFADLLSDDGYLFVGHSETLYRVTDRFELIGQTIYRKAGVTR